MNELIKELADQSWNTFDLRGVEVGPPYVFAERFAELIVRECSIVIQDFVDHRIPASEYPKQLKEHFGVE